MSPVSGLLRRRRSLWLGLTAAACSLAHQVPRTRARSLTNLRHMPAMAGLSLPTCAVSRWARVTLGPFQRPLQRTQVPPNPAA